MEIRNDAAMIFIYEAKKELAKKMGLEVSVGNHTIWIQKDDGKIIGTLNSLCALSGFLDGYREGKIGMETIKTLNVKGFPVQIESEIENPGNYIEDLILNKPKFNE
jgi:predicted acetyltransferase